MTITNMQIEKESKNPGRFIKIAVGFIISFVFLWLVLRGVSWNDLVTYGSRMNLWFFALALLVHPVKFLLTAYRWRIFLKPVKDISTGKLFPIVAVAFGANIVLPLRAGEAVRIYTLKKFEDVRMSTGLSTVAVERLVDMATLLIFLAFLGISVPMDTTLKHVFQLLTVICLLGAAGIYLALGFRKQLLGIVQKYVSTRFEKVGSVAEGLLHQFIEGLEAFQSPLALVKISVLSILMWLVEALVYYLVAKSLGISYSIVACLFIMVCASLGTLVPSSPGYVGVFEWAVMLASSAFPVVKAQALAFAFASHLALTVPITILGFVYALKLSIFRKGSEILQPISLTEQKDEKDSEEIRTEELERPGREERERALQGALTSESI